MKTILILTDLSEMSLHAAKYACVLANQLNSTEVILYHACVATLALTDKVEDAVDMDLAIQRDCQEQLDKMREQLLPYLPPFVVVRTMVEPNDLASSINTISDAVKADLIVMGTNSSGNWEQPFLGNVTAKVLASCITPLILVPGGTRIEPVSRIVFACDLKVMPESMPTLALKKVLENFNVPVTVVNVQDPDGAELNDRGGKEGEVFKLLLDHITSFHHIYDKDVIDGIVVFSLTHRISLIVVVPKQHGFFDRLFKQSVTKQLASQTDLPLMILHEKAKVREVEPF